MQYPLWLTFLIVIGCTAPAIRKPADAASESSSNQILIHDDRNDPVACEIFQRSLPADIKWGYVEEKDAELGRQIKIFYYGKWKTKPLIIANGGPGGSSWSTYKVMRESLEKEKIEYLFFDQKGTGCSSPYPPLDLGHQSVWQSYSSGGLAADVEELRRKLKLGRKVSVFGQSFGVKIALQYAIKFPDSTRSAILYGDSFVDPEDSVVDAIATTLQKQDAFLSIRLSNPKLEATLKSLMAKFRDYPCAADRQGLISACGFDLIRDLGHYYTESTADRIENLLFKLDDPKTADEAFHDVISKYTHWKIDPVTVLLGYMDYRNLIGDQLSCDLALKKVSIPPWHLNSCVLAKYQRPFLMNAHQHIHQDLVTPGQVDATLGRNTDVKIYALDSLEDLDSGDTPKVHLPKNWIRVRLDSVDHFNFFHSAKFWMIVKSALSNE